MHHRVPIRNHEWIREGIRHCWPIDAGHHFSQASGTDLMAKHRSVRRGMPPFASLTSSYRFCIGRCLQSGISRSAMSSVRQHNCTNRSPHSGEPSLPTGVPHTSSTDETPLVPRSSRLSPSKTRQSGSFQRLY